MSDKLLPPFLIDIAEQAQPVDFAALDAAQQRQMLRNVGSVPAGARVLRLTIRPIFISNKPNDKRWRRRHSLSKIDRIQVQLHAPWPDVEIQGYAPRTRPLADEGTDMELGAAFDLPGFSLSGKVKQELQRRTPRFDIFAAWYATGTLQWVFAETFVRDQEEIVLDLLLLISAETSPALRLDVAFYDGSRVVQAVSNKQVSIE